MNVYCNNCGKKGHLFKKCNSPITSIGIILFHIDEKKQPNYLMIRRKHSMSYISFVRGIYNIMDIGYIRKLLNHMTNDEKIRLINCEFDKLWRDLWANDNYVIRNFSKIQNKFNRIKRGVCIKNTVYHLNNLVHESKNNWEEQEWGFPKGKSKNNESNLMCAKREFNEETNIAEDKYNILNIKPVKEIFTGLNGLRYKYIYYIAQMKSNIDLPELNVSNKFQKMEISDIKWMTYHKGVQKIRYYSHEKKNTFKKTHDKISTQS